MKTLLLLLPLVLVGCGGSSVRFHATAAYAFHDVVETAGDSIPRACALDLDRCGIGDAACIDASEHRCTTAAAARDTLIAPVNVYRRLALSSCGIDADHPPDVIPETCPEQPPEVREHLQTVWESLTRDFETLRAAVAALMGDRS